MNLPFDKVRYCCRTLLEVIACENGVSRHLLPYLCGYSNSMLNYAIAELRKKGLIERNCGQWFATERGKILIAIIIGKETKQRAQRNGQG